MQFVLVLLLLGVAAVDSQTTFTECSAGWVKYLEQCYKFVNYPRLMRDEASVYCQKDGAALLSVNDELEHIFVEDWLEKYDGSRDTWLTSGIVRTQPDGVEWLGDGSRTQTTDFNKWHEDVTKEDSDIVVYAFESVQYKWNVGDPGKQSSFVCEIPLQEIYKIVDDKRNFDYGLDIDNPNLAPRGPKFVLQPVDTTILSKTEAAFMDCQADGNPKPTYVWYRGSEEQMSVLQTGPDAPDRRFSLTGGRLTITDPRSADEGTYQCYASNEFGTIVSKAVVLGFGSLGDFSNVPTNNVQGQLADGVAIECPPISARPGKTYQWYKQKDENSPPIFIRPEIQQHTFISNSGKLYFSELAPSDAAIYTCMVSLSNVRGTGSYIGSNQEVSRVSLGFRLSISSGVSSDYNPVIQDDFIKVYPGNAKRGQTIQLECFAYGTAPLVYQWYRYDAEIPRTASFSETRRVMTIENVQIEDSGKYGCRVDGRKTKEHSIKNYTLDVQAEPYFSYPLTNQHVDIGSRLAWHCEARGKPSPAYTWYKNGELLSNSPGVTINGNTMVIDQLQKERDNGMYQCAATNLYGTTFSSAQIRVLEFKPTFRKRPVDSSLSAAVGGNITIVCNPEGAPAPTFQWLRNGADLGLVLGGAPSNGFSMLLNGNLFIENINNGHEGTYTCKVTNPIGEASSSGVLRVFPKVVISQVPKPVWKLINETASILCTASAPPNVDVVYVWKFNDHLIDFEENVEFRMGTGATAGNLFIVGVQYKHEGFYTCQVTTGMDSVSASAKLTVQGPPGEPSGLFEGDNKGQDINLNVGPNDKFIRLYWSNGPSHEGTIMAYTVEFNTNFDKTWRVHSGADRIPVQDVQSGEYPDKLTVLLKDLKPYAGHQFRVRAINQFGVGAPSIPTSIIQVPGTAPLMAPTGVSGGGGKVGNLVITWQPLPLEDHNGPDFRYIVYWRAKPTSPTDNSRWQNSSELLEANVCHRTPDINEGQVYICSFTTLVGAENYYMPYEVRVRSKNAYGPGMISDIYTVMSAEEMPTATPQGVYAVSYNATALMVFWTPLENTREIMKGKLTGYRINYWNKDTETQEQARFNIIPVPPGQDNIDHGLIIGLQPGNWYLVQVQSISSAGYGRVSELYPQETSNFAPGAYPTEVQVYSIEGIGVRVNFRGISTKVAEEPLMGYKIQYWPSGENIRKAQTKDVGRNNYGTITNLTESVLYQLRIFGYSRGGQGKRSSPSVYFTVGDGAVAFHPETTEVMAGSSFIQPSITLLLCLLLPVVIAHHRHR